nr:LysR family transcriptional regulator [uncultured Blautia sp.]
MNLYHLRYFVTLAHLEHYTKAADVLAITQPSLSHAISSLEEELGVKLFEKNGRNVSLTKYGKTFLADVEETLNRLDSSVNGLQLAGRGEGQIDVAFLRTLGVDFVPKIIRNFLTANEGRKINFNLYCDKVLTGDILTGLKEKKYDIGFCSRFDDEPLIEFIPVAKQDLVVIMPQDHPLTEKAQIHLEDTLPYKQIIFKKRSGLRQIIDQLFRTIGQYPDVAFEIDEDQVAAGFVANGFGISIAPDIPILHSLELEIRPLVSPSWQRNFYMAMLKDVYHPPVVEAFKKFVMEAANKEMFYKTN